MPVSDDVVPEEDEPDAPLSEDGFVFAGFAVSTDGVPEASHDGSSPEHVETMLLSPERLIGEFASKRTKESPARATIRSIYTPYTLRILFSVLDAIY